MNLIAVVKADEKEDQNEAEIQYSCTQGNDEVNPVSKRKQSPDKYEEVNLEITQGENLIKMIQRKVQIAKW